MSVSCLDKKKVCARLTGELEAIGLKASFFDLDGTFLAATNNPSAAVDSASTTILRDAGGNDYCQVQLPVDGFSRALPRIQVLLDLSTTGNVPVGQCVGDTGELLSFVYQILYSVGTSRNSLLSRASQLGQNPFLPRCVMVFDFSDSGENAEPATDERRACFLRAVEETPGHDEQDFGSFLAGFQYVLFKIVPTSNRQTRRQRLENYAVDLCAHCDADYSELRVGIGTIYSDLRQMNESYDEAQFVVKNLPVLDSTRQIGFAADYTYDYLISLIPEEQQKKHPAPYITRLRKVSYLPETFKAFVAADYNLSATARQLGLHRNTMLQRYKRLIEATGIDPIHISSQNMLARQCAVYLNRKTVLHVGIIIQNTSDLYRGCRHFAALVKQLSDDTMTVHVINVGISGNNRMLIELLLRNELDFIIGDTDTLIPYVGDEISVCNLPHLFSDDDDAYEQFTGSAGQYLLGLCEDTPLRCLAFWSMGWRYLTCRGEPAHTPEELAGKRVRTMEKALYHRYLSGLGAIPISISYDKILSALAEKIVDYQENPAVNFCDLRLYEQHDTMLAEKSFFSVSALVTSAACLSHMTTEQRRIVIEAARHTTLWQWQSTKRHNELCLRQLREEHGVRIYCPTPTEQVCWNAYAKQFRAAFEHRHILAMFHAAGTRRIV